MRYFLRVFFIGITLLLLRSACFCQTRSVVVKCKRNEDKSVDFSYEKEIPGSFYLNLQFSDLDNTSISDYKGVVSGLSGHIVTLRPTNDTKHIHFKYKYSYVRGVPNPKVDSLFTYVLPFSKGRAVKVVESPNLGKQLFNNAVPRKWKSYQFNIPEADTVCSVRKGIVVSVVDQFSSDTTKSYHFTRNRNRVLVEHSDGTFASYSGFNRGAIFVEPGQRVYPHSPLGILGRLDQREIYRLYFHIYFLYTSDIELLRDQTLASRKSMHEFITPFFSTDKGIMQLKNRSVYKVDINESIFFREFSRREKKRYKSGKLKL